MDLTDLKAERNNLKEELRTIELEGRELDKEVKALRQREIRAKRQIEALDTLIETMSPPEEKDEAQDKIRVEAAPAAKELENG